MTLSQVESGEYQVPAEIYERLAAVTPMERADIVLQLIAEHPQGRLALPAHDGLQAMLNEIDLSGRALQARPIQAGEPPAWWNAEREGVSLRSAQLQGANLRLAYLQRADLRQADLQGASMGEADLQGATLEEADLQHADLVGANLQGAALGEANLQDAFLEEANLQDTALRFANLQGAVLESSKLQHADLWGANLGSAILASADLQGATLEEANLQEADLTGANLQGAILGKANLQGAKLSGADLQGADLDGANLQGAVLRDARLQDVILTNAITEHIHIGGAWLDKTRLEQDQLGEAIGEELAGEYAEAGKGYLALERNFVDLGDPDAASWAYRKKRRMQKLDARAKARSAWTKRQWQTAAAQYAKYAGDQLVEWLCDYGESIPRVLASLIVVFILFALIYGLTGTVVRVEQTPHGPVRVPTRNPLDLLLFSLLAMTFQTIPDLETPGQVVRVIIGTEVLVGVFLTGLLGFVAGNRIRR